MCLSFTNRLEMEGLGKTTETEYMQQARELARIELVRMYTCIPSLDPTGRLHHPHELKFFEAFFECLLFVVLVRKTAHLCCNKIIQQTYSNFTPHTHTHTQSERERERDQAYTLMLSSHRCCGRSLWSSPSPQGRLLLPCWYVSIFESSESFLQDVFPYEISIPFNMEISPC